MNFRAWENGSLPSSPHPFPSLPESFCASYHLSLPPAFWGPPEEQGRGGRGNTTQLGVVRLRRNATMHGTLHQPCAPAPSLSGMLCSQPSAAIRLHDSIGLSEASKSAPSRHTVRRPTCHCEGALMDDGGGQKQFESRARQAFKKKATIHRICGEARPAGSFFGSHGPGYWGCRCLVPVPMAAWREEVDSSAFRRFRAATQLAWFWPRPFGSCPPTASSRKAELSLLQAAPRSDRWLAEKAVAWTNAQVTLSAFEKILGNWLFEREWWAFCLKSLRNVASWEVSRVTRDSEAG